MPNGMQAAVTEATRLDEIGFPEFTAKLVTDVFDALVSANLRQTEVFLELVSHVSKELATFINDTKDDIGGDLLLQFLAKVAPDEGDETGTQVKVGGGVPAAEVDAFKESLKVEGVEDKPLDGVDITAIDEDKYKAILDAVAQRIAADKYTLLKEMVKLGILRLVVEHGVIETRLTFTTYGSTFYESQKRKYHRDSFKFKAKAKTGSIISAYVKASASTSYNSVNVRTAKVSNRDISGSQVQIYGRVQIDFKTDYQPLST